MSKIVLPLMAIGWVLCPHAGYAANASAPYANVDHRNDAGNDTGDSQVDKLNDMQLDKNYQGPTYPQGAPPVTQTAPVQPK
jgi:hypothetical protein